MAAYEYLAVDSKGKEEKGILEADSPRQVRQLLREKALTPISVSAARKTRERGSSSNWFKHLLASMSPAELALVTRQLATLIGAGLPVEEALLAVSRQSERRATGTMLLDIRSRVLEGFSLAQSLTEYPRAFPDLYRATIASGEASGHLDIILNQLADFTEAAHGARLRIQQAMIYPLLLLVMTILILTGMLVYVVPDIVDIFEKTGQELPALTRFVIAASEFVSAYGYLLVVLLVALIVIVRRILDVPEIRLSWDKTLLKLPVAGRMTRSNGAASFASTLSILTSSGVPLVDAMGIAEKVISNRWLQKVVGEARIKVREGTSLNNALAKSESFPPMMLHMIASGEASGELDSMLSRAASYLQQEREAFLGVLLSLLGPLMLLFMGGTVFAIVMAILLPIMNLNQLIS